MSPLSQHLKTLETARAAVNVVRYRDVALRASHFSSHKAESTFNMAANGPNGNNVGVGTEAIRSEIITLSRFLTEEQRKHKEATGDFTYVVSRVDDNAC